NARARLLEHARDVDRRRAARVVRVGLERKAENADRLAAEIATQRPFDLLDHQFLLALVRLDHGLEHAELVARLLCDPAKGAGVLRKAGAPEPRSWIEELRADATVETERGGDRLDVAADDVADIRDLVDERDLRRQERVGRVLDQLRGPNVGDDEAGLAAE